MDLKKSSARHLPTITTPTTLSSRLSFDATNKILDHKLTEFSIENISGFIGNGSSCKEPPKLETGFLIVSQGVAAVKIPLSGNKRGTPVSTASM